MASYYDTGTVAVLVDGTTVTGTSTAWAANAKEGDLFIGWDATGFGVGVLAADPSDTSLTLVNPWLGPELSGDDYLILHTGEGWDPAVDIWVRVQELLAQLEEVGILADNLASTDTGKGASLIGIEDAGTFFTGETVEAALAEIGPALADIAGKQPSDADLTAIAALGSTGIAVRSAADTWVQRSIAVTASTGLSVANGSGAAGNPTLAGIDATTSAKGVAEIATAAEYRTGTDTARVVGVAEVWAAAALAALTDGATIAVNFASGINFGGASNAVLALGGNRTLGAPSNLVTGQTGILWFGAASSTRTLTLNAAWLLMDGVEAGPYSITTSQILGLAYFVRASVVYVVGILRRAA